MALGDTGKTIQVSEDFQKQVLLFMLQEQKKVWETAVGITIPSETLTRLFETSTFDEKYKEEFTDFKYREQITERLERLGPDDLISLNNKFEHIQTLLSDNQTFEKAYQEISESTLELTEV